MTINFETQKGRFAFVNLPYNAFNVDIRSLGQYNVVYFEPCNEETEFTVVSDFKEKVTIIGFVKDLTEEQWSEVVDETWDVPNGYINAITYYRNYVDGYDEFQVASNSGKSLMESLDLDDSNWLLIKYDIRRDIPNNTK